jgi:hypothetical protein
MQGPNQTVYFLINVAVQQPHKAYFMWAVECQSLSTQ